jgi:hypothetical protein
MEKALAGAAEIVARTRRNAPRPNRQGLQGCPLWSRRRQLAQSKEESSSFLEKRTKKLLFVIRRVPKRIKVFWFFFSKKN